MGWLTQGSTASVSSSSSGPFGCFVTNGNLYFNSNTNSQATCDAFGSQGYCICFLKEFDTLPDTIVGVGYNNRDSGLRKVVDDWILGGATKADVIAQYGEIENWDMLQVTDMGQLFKGKDNFNGDVSKWNTAKVTTMQSSTYILHKI